MGHESGQDSVTVFIIPNYGQAFSTFKTTQAYFSVWKTVIFSLETELFLAITGDKSRKSDWN